MRFGRKVCFLPVGEQLLHCFEGKKILLYTEGTVKIMNTDNLSVSSDIYMNFVNPPRGYGNVPFYGWNGDVLDTERIDSQLKLLSAGGVSGVQINFCHSCPAHDPKLGGGGFGKTYECTPAMFTDEWWEIVNHTFRTAKKLGLGVGISDYTIGWIGNGFFVDKVVYESRLCATELKCDIKEMTAGESISERSADVLVRAFIPFTGKDIVYPDMDELQTAVGAQTAVHAESDEKSDIGAETKYDPGADMKTEFWTDMNYKAGTDMKTDVGAGVKYEGGTDTESEIGTDADIDDRGVSSPSLYTVPCGGRLITVRREVNKDSIDVMNPEAGKLLCRLFYENFLSHIDEDCRDVLNYCFQDEFIAGCDFGHLWSDGFSERFKELKGYDIVPKLYLLFDDCGRKSEAAAVRLDYADVKARFIEDGYFKPIYEFHKSRGLVYGCDQCSRGYNPSEYGDYFRAVKYFTAPGNDTPNRCADLIKVKASSSAAHLYGHERVWLEGYHSSGWGTSLASLSAPTSENFIFGANLLCMHGLYYSTYGSMWEWAPPDFHFRMPYWEHAKVWYGYYERLSYMLTRGSHRCDCAVYYPVSSYDTGFSPDRAKELTFAAAERLHKEGIDFDFIDFESISRAQARDGRLCVSGEEYKMLIFCGVDSVRYETLASALRFSEDGGTVVFIGEAPVYTDCADSKKSEKLIGRLSSGARIIPVKNSEEMEKVYFADIFSERSICRDFLPERNAFALHRAAESGDIYFVRGGKGERCVFNTSGYCQFWNPLSGERFSYPAECITEEGREYRALLLPCEGDNLFFFSDERQDIPAYIFESSTRCTVLLDGEWDFSLIPTMDNTYGDFRFPSGKYGGDKIIGAEIRRLKIDGEDAFCGRYSPFVCKTVDGETSPLVYDRCGFLDGSITEQGYHGLKKCVYNFEMCLPESGFAEYEAYAHTESEEKVVFEIYGEVPDELTVDGKDVLSAHGVLVLSPGMHRVALKFENMENSSQTSSCDCGTKFEFEKDNCRERNLAKKKREIGRSGIFIRRARNKERRSYVLHGFSSMADAEVKESAGRLPLSNDWFARDDRIRLTSAPMKEKLTAEFETAPGTEELIITVFGRIAAAFADGCEISFAFEGRNSYGAGIYRLVLPSGERGSKISIELNPANGYNQGDVFPEPIREKVGCGKILTGDFTEYHGLECYSGIAVYETVFAIDTDGAEISSDGCRLMLNLGEVGCSCKISVNGYDAGCICSGPFRIDITDFICRGKNRLRVEVANTLCGHYSTTPSLYSGWPQDRKSGLIGPVSLSFVSCRK